MTRIEKAVSLFRELDNWNDFKACMLEMGFRHDESGCSKDVFVHLKEEYVVKLIHGHNGTPSPKQVALLPYFVPLIFFKGKYLYKICEYSGVKSRGKYRFALQRRVNKARAQTAANFLERKAKELGVKWLDCKDHNVGHLDGKPAIVDF